MKSFLWFAFLVFLLFAFCEFVVYYLVLLQCTWPELVRAHLDPYVPLSGDNRPLRVMLLADTHLLGWRNGHWFDKLRREWQMERAFQTAMFIHNPDVVFVLGDLLDEGKWASDDEFYHHVARFRRIFRTARGAGQVQVVVGNHDIGFHHDVTRHKYQRFRGAWTAPSVRRFSLQGNHFVMLNSMAFEGDACAMCQEAEKRLAKVAKELACARGDDLSVRADCDGQVEDKVGQFSRPILLQHFPLFRTSEAACPEDVDGPPPEVRRSEHREKLDCLSKEASKKLLQVLRPRLVLSGHTHFSCVINHTAERIPEFTVASFSWRNLNSPSFLLMKVTPNDYAIGKCFLPQEHTVIWTYTIGLSLILLWFLKPYLSALRLLFLTQAWRKTL